jgi:pimeloyl-ACP methyl ester carboxylesterase
MTSTRNYRVIVAAAGIAFGILLSAEIKAARNQEIISNPVYLKPQQLIDVEGGRHLNLYCIGTGSPTVVFDSGLGEGMVAWALVQPQVALHARACAYDRAGLGFSDPSLEPRTSAFLVQDLRSLLKKARIKPPYVLVGHSFGGMNIKLFAEQHPREVAGMVFVDPSHEDLTKRAWQISPELAESNARYNAFLQTCLDAKPEDFVPGSPLKENCATPPFAERLSPEIRALEDARDLTYDCRQAWISEQLNVWTKSAEQLRAAYRSLGDLPLVVLTHEPLPRRKNQTQEIADAQNKVRMDLHTEISRMSTRGVIRVVKDSEHHFQLDQPQEVTAAILEVLDSLVSGHRTTHR